MPLQLNFIAPAAALVDFGRNMIADLNQMAGIAGAWSASNAGVNPQTGTAIVPVPASAGPRALALAVGGSVQVQGVSGFGASFRMEGRLAARHSFDAGNVGAAFTIGCRFSFEDLQTSFQTVLGFDVQNCLRYSPSANRFQFVIQNEAINAPSPVQAGWYDALMCVGGSGSRLYIGPAGGSIETVDHTLAWAPSNMRIGGTANGGTGGFTGHLRNAILVDRSLQADAAGRALALDWLAA